MPSHLLKRRAQHLRTSQTDAEQRLWHYLRAHRFFNLKFRRQRPIGPYIVDFVCVEAAIVIELDGGQHQEQASYDQQRTQFLAQRGFHVLRFWDNDVLQQTDQVLEAIRLACRIE